MSRLQKREHHHETRRVRRRLCFSFARENGTRRRRSCRRTPELSLHLSIKKRKNRIYPGSAAVARLKLHFLWTPSQSQKCFHRKLVIQTTVSKNCHSFKERADGEYPCRRRGTELPPENKPRGGLATVKKMFSPLRRRSDVGGCGDVKNPESSNPPVWRNYRLIF